MSSSSPANYVEVGQKRDRSTSDEELSPKNLNKKMVLDESEQNTLLEKFSALLNQKLSELREDMKRLAGKSDVVEIKNIVEGIRKENELLKLEVDMLKVEVAEVKTENLQLHKRVEAIDRQQRRNRIVIKGLKVNENTVSDDVKKFMVEVLGFGQSPVINNAYTIPVGGESTSVKMIIVEFAEQEAVRHIWTTVKRLKNTGISINRDHPPEVRNRINKLLKLRAVMRAKCPQVAVNIWQDRLKVAEHTFEWSEREGVVSEGGDGTAMLNAIVKQDMAGIIMELKTERRPARKIEEKKDGTKPRKS
ncbi:hypothetical protein GE061_014706 [Apolygus lucorum]|uniref:L1 transposable element RRM domain-containing protein n=1 Tax=Apolygus lucorum TaxID=248454 RepID=A0A6A4JAM9_APOLU|nr:hypothetical protein GE061_018088 [Apolygus lucorum]KAF6208963.1 hypothetical protein GE061_014706 [Apolygus lucorum]